MMAAGIFTITELRNASDPAQADEGERFEWTADARPVTPFDGVRGGGARACPIKPWAQPNEQRQVRTDYPGAKTPSRQILGPRCGAQTFRGRWDDRYNGAGYALAEWRRFIAMCERGNLVRVQYGPILFDGLITAWTPSVLRLWHIEYEFTFDPDGRPEDADTIRLPVTPQKPAALLDRFDVAVQALLDADAVAPRNAIAGTLADGVTSDLVAMTVARESLFSTIDARDIRPPENPIDGFTRIATQFRSGRGAAYDLILRLGAVRADTDMSVMTAIGVLDFEDWIRSLRYASRIAMGSALSGDRAATERAEPDAVRLYRPQANEHLYAISRKFYGTPHAWRMIYDRNSLSGFTMTGAEILVIPERGGV
jgi:hypothetical protein